MNEPSDEDVARMFHEAYERLAPSFGYTTRKASAVPWEDVPDANKRLMIAVAADVRAALARPEPAGGALERAREVCGCPACTDPAVSVDTSCRRERIAAALRAYGDARAAEAARALTPTGR